MLYTNLRALPAIHKTTRRQQPKPPSNQRGFIRIFLMLVLVAGLIWGALTTTGLAKAQAEAPQPEIASAVGDYCLDDYHNQVKPNSPVVAWPCNGSPAQDWVVSGSQIKKAGGYCLDNQSGRVVVNACNGSTSEQWSLDGVGFSNTNTNLCLSLNSGKLKTQLLAISCNNLSSINEAWTPTQWQGAPLTAISSPACNQQDLGQRVACLAQRQWLAWQTEPALHSSLLSDYTDGNPTEEWCADFVSYLYAQAGAPFSSGERGLNGWDEYNANNISSMGFSYHPADGSYSPHPGDVAFFNYSGGHVEVVISGGKHPTFIYGDSGTIDPLSGNGNMAENQITSDGSLGSLVYYLSPN